MKGGDAVRVTTVVEVDPTAAFAVFTEEVDAWWRDGPRFRWYPDRKGRLVIEPGEGGRFVEVYPDAAHEPFEVGRVRVWDPPRRLVFSFRARSFAPAESTEVEVRFEPEGEVTRVSVEHRGWAALRSDHPARHGMDASAFDNMMGVWWADLLTAARRYVAMRAGERPGGREDEAMAMSEKGFDLATTYLSLPDGPDVTQLEVGPDFWETIEERTDLGERLVGVFHYEADWTSWEVHPEGDEVVVLISGAVDLVLDEPGGPHVVELRDRGATAIVPRRVWHTANVSGPGEALHVTRGKGTTHRPR